VVPKHEQDHPGLVQLLSKDDGGEELVAREPYTMALRERDAGESNEERANASDEADARCRHDRFRGERPRRDGPPPAEDGGEDDQAIDEEGAHPWICARFVSPP
jgi:hypothetical protein